MTTIPKTEIRRLSECAGATNSPTGFMLEKPARFKMALAQGFVDSNETIAEGDKIAFRITSTGMQYLVSEEAQEVLGVDEPASEPAPENWNEAVNSLHNPVDIHTAHGTLEATPQTFTPPQQTAQTGKPKMSQYQVITVGNLEEFTKRTRNAGDRKYPFDSLEVGQGFAVYPTADMPEPWKSLQSTVSTASRRYAEVTGTYVDKAGKERNRYRFERKFAVKKQRDANGYDFAMVARIPVAADDDGSDDE